MGETPTNFYGGGPLSERDETVIISPEWGD